MASRVIAETWESMTNSERIALCRAMTGTAITLAQVSPPNIADAFLHLAESWARLGTEIARASLETQNRDLGIYGVVQLGQSDKP